MNTAIIVAGGSGSRFSDELPKQFIKIDEQEILSFSVNTFLIHPQINEVIIVSHPEWVNHVTKEYPECKVINGGVRRQDSTLNGIRSVSNETENVLIHDAARPFISQEIISVCLAALVNADGSAPVITATNSLIQVEEGKVTYMDRSNIKEVQTPQCFRKELVLRGLTTGIEGTDELGIILRLFPKSIINLVPGNQNNFKITTQLDLELATYYLKSRVI